MIISTIIALICFVAVVFECLFMYNTFRKCKKVNCKVISSEKKQKRENGYLVEEYWNTDVTFRYKSEEKLFTLKTSTYCVKGQSLNCYYFPEKDIVFRKRDMKKKLTSSSLVVTSVGILFLLLNFLFQMTGVSRLIIKNIVEILAAVISAVYLLMGTWHVGYSLNAIRKTSKSRIIITEAKIVDVIMKSRRYNENIRNTYYPVYHYYFNGESHETQSKLKRKEPPKIGSTASIFVDRKKGGPVEYNDVANSLIMGILFILISGLTVYAAWFMK